MAKKNETLAVPEGKFVALKNTTIGSKLIFKGQEVPSAMFSEMPDKGVYSFIPGEKAVPTNDVPVNPTPQPVTEKDISKGF